MGLGITQKINEAVYIGDDMIVIAVGAIKRTVIMVVALPDGDLVRLSIAPGQTRRINNDISFTLMRISRNQCRINYDVPRDIPILRESLYFQTKNNDVNNKAVLALK